MKSKISALIANQLPQHVQSTSEVFVLFLEAYYEWLEQRNNSIGVINYFPENTDIDRTVDDFLVHFLETYAEYIPRETEYNKRDLVKRLSDLYLAKGSSAAVKFLFRLVYNTEAEVFFPRENILRASDGRWDQKTTIRVTRQSGVIGNISEKSIFWSNSSGYFEAKILGVEELEPNVFDISVRLIRAVTLNVNDVLTVIDDATNQVIFTGLARKTPDFISIIDPGKYFQIGQIFEIDGSNFNTVFKVTDVTETGAIKNLRIIKFGYDYQSDLITSLIPFPDTNFEINFTLNIVPGGFAIGLTEKVVNFEDQIQIDISYGEYNPNSFYAQDYVLSDEYYVAYRVIDQKTATGKPPSGSTNQGFFNNSNLTEQDLQDSVATVRLNLGTLSKYQGRWLTVDGFLNESSIRIQDSQFYQDFSYVVRSNVTLRKYRDMLINVLHPAGTKFFSELLLSETLDLSQLVMVDELRQYLIQLNEKIVASDSLAKDFTTFKSDDQAAIDADPAKSVTQAKSESVSLTDSDQKLFTTAKSNDQSIDDTISKDITFDTFNDSFTVLDSELASGEEYVTDISPYYSEIYVANYRDIVVKDINSGKEESQLSQDDLGAKDLNLVAEDQPVADDTSTVASQFERSFDENQSVTDSNSLNFNTSVDDSSSVTDDQTKSFDQTNTESLTVTDQETKSFEQGTTDDSVAVTDQETKSFEQGTTDDSVAVTDQETKSFEQENNEAVIAEADNFTENYTQGAQYFEQQYMDPESQSTIIVS